MSFSHGIKVNPPKGVVSVDVEGPTNGRRSVKCNNTVTASLMRLLIGPGQANAPVDAIMSHIVIGTGTDEILFTDTSLTSQVGSTTVDASPDPVDVDIEGTIYKSLTVSATFPPGTLVGQLTEVGMTSSYATSELIAGTLIKDDLGVPTSVTVLSDDQITVTYTLLFDFAQFNNVEIHSGIVTINEVDHAFTATHVTFLHSTGTNLYVRTPSTPVGGTSAKVLFVNGNNPTSTNCDVTVTENYDEVARSMEWVVENTVFATYASGDISNLGTMVSPSLTGSTTPVATVQLDFTPAIPRGEDTKITLNYRFKITW